MKEKTCTVRNITTTVYNCCTGYGVRTNRVRTFLIGYGRNNYPSREILKTQGCNFGMSTYYPLVCVVHTYNIICRAEKDGF